MRKAHFFRTTPSLPGAAARREEVSKLRTWHILRAIMRFNNLI
jgi:hypothetical protein